MQRKQNEKKMNKKEKKQLGEYKRKHQSHVKRIGCGLMVYYSGLNLITLT